MTTHGFRRHGPKKPYIFIQKSSFRSLLLELPLHLTGTDHLDFEAASCLMESLCNLNHIVRMLPVQKASTPQNGCFCFAVNQVINAGIPDRLRKVTPFVAPIMEKAEFCIIPRGIGTGAEHICLPPRRIVIMPLEKSRYIFQNRISSFQRSLGISEKQFGLFAVFLCLTLWKGTCYQNIQII